MHTIEYSVSCPITKGSQTFIRNVLLTTRPTNKQTEAGAYAAGDWMSAQSTPQLRSS